MAILFRLSIYFYRSLLHTCLIDFPSSRNDGLQYLRSCSKEHVQARSLTREQLCDISSFFSLVKRDSTFSLTWLTLFNRDMHTERERERERTKRIKWSTVQNTRKGERERGRGRERERRKRNGIMRIVWRRRTH